MLSRDSKLLLKNVIRHTDTHNRLQEEAEMWKQRDTERTTRKRRQDPHRTPIDERQCFPSAHMDRVGDSPGDTTERLDEGPSNRFLLEYCKAVDADPDRWGHSGYRELYPDLFAEPKPNRDSSSDSNSSNDSKIKKKKNKKKNSKEHKSKKKSKTKKPKKEKRVKKKKREKRKGISDTSESSDVEESKEKGLSSSKPSHRTSDSCSTESNSKTEMQSTYRSQSKHKEKTARCTEIDVSVSLSAKDFDYSDRKSGHSKRLKEKKLKNKLEPNRTHKRKRYDRTSLRENNSSSSEDTESE